MVSQICRSFFSFVNMWPKHVHMVCFCSSNASLWSSDFSVRVQTKCQRNSPRLTCSVPFCFPGMLVWVRRKWPAENSVGALDVQFWNSGTNRFWLFLKMDLILWTTADMAVGSVGYSWQENYPEKVLMIQETRSLPWALWQRQGNVPELSVSNLY